MMKAERWEKVDRLLDEALALPLSERDAFLNRATSGDEELRREVASLLHAHDRADGKFLDAPALEIAARGLAARPDHSLIGKKFGSYQIISVLGVGGMGEVYLARDERLGRQLALKLLPAQYVKDSGRIERFAREARAVSALNHPNIVTVYDIGETEGTHFIAMEHVDGMTLRDKLLTMRHGQSDPREIVEIALQISAALAAAHEAGIIHRDIKPENLMLRRDDYLKVLDFGLAKLTENQFSPAKTHEEISDPGATNPGTVLGTLRYMSPEQAVGKDVDGRSDIFSLGIVLYELLTGSPPFKGDKPAAILDAIAHHAPIPLSQLRPELNPEFERIINRMLEKDRDLRYQTARDLRAKLKQLKRELDTSATQSLNSGSLAGLNDSGAAKLPASFGKLQLLAAISAVIALFTAGFAAWWFWSQREAVPSPWMNAYSSQLTDFPAEERNPSLSPDGKIVFYSRRVKGQWDIFWQRVGGSKPTNLTSDCDEDDTQPACSPDGASVVFRSERNGGGLFVMGATGENVHQLSRFGQNPSWSPNGAEVVCGTDYILDPKRRTAKSRLLIINVASGKERDLLNTGDAAQPRWSPNGNRIAFYYRTDNNRRDVWTIAADGSDPRPVTNDDAVDWNPVWSDDGNHLYFASDRKGVASLWRVPIDEVTGHTLGKFEPVSGQSAEVLQMDLSRDGRHIAYANRIQDANIKSIQFDPVKLTTFGEVTAVTMGSRPAGSPDLSPDGQMVAFHSLGAAREDIWLVRADGSGQTNLTDDEALDRSPRWSPKGDRLAFFSDTTNPNQIWLMNPDGSHKQQITFSPSACSFPVWSPKGDRLAYNVRQQGTQIIEMNRPWNQQTPVTLPLINETDWFNGYAWSPDGRFLVGTAATLQGKEVRSREGIFVYLFADNRYEQITKVGSRPDWLADSHHVMFVYAGKGEQAEKQIWVVDLATKAIKPVYSHPTNLISTFGLTRDNRRLFFTATAHQADIFLLSLEK